VHTAKAEVISSELCFSQYLLFSLLRVLSDGRYTAPTVQLFTSQRKPVLLDSLR